MKTFIFFISVVLLIIFFGDLIFLGDNLSTGNHGTILNSSNQNFMANENNKSLLFTNNLYIQKPLSINLIDSLTAFENLKFTKPNAQKLIVKM